MKRVVKFWNIWGGIEIGTLIAWLNHFEKITMDNVTSYLALILTCIGIFTFTRSIFKERIEEKKGTAKTKKLKPKQVLMGEEIARELNETIKIAREMKEGKRMKKFFKWLWGNKFTLISLIISVGCVSFVNFMSFCGYMDRYAIYRENQILFQMLFLVGGALYLVVDIFTTVSKYGCESLEQLNTRYEKRREEKLNALTPEQKKFVKENITKLEKSYEELKKKLTTSLNTIESYKALSSIEGFDIGSLKEGYSQALAFVNANQSVATELERQINILKARLK